MPRGAWIPTGNRTRRPEGGPRGQSPWRGVNDKPVTNKSHRKPITAVRPVELTIEQAEFIGASTNARSRRRWKVVTLSCGHHVLRTTVGRAAHCRNCAEAQEDD